MHFEKDGEGNTVQHPGDDGSYDNDDTALVKSELKEVVNDSEKCNLDSWCFVENMKPQVLLQVCNLTVIVRCIAYCLVLNITEMDLEMC